MKYCTQGSDAVLFQQLCYSQRFIKALPIAMRQIERLEHENAELWKRRLLNVQSSSLQ